METVLPVVTFTSFMLFIFLMAIAYSFRDTFYSRTVVITIVIGALIIANIAGIYLFPIVQMQKFDSTVSDTMADYELHVVDESGNELLLDPQVVDPAISASAIHGHQIEETSEQEREALAEYFFTQAQQHRTDIESQTHPISAPQFPHNTREATWDADTLSEYDDFQMIRLYRVNKEFTDTNEIERSDTLIYEWSADGDGAGTRYYSNIGVDDSSSETDKQERLTVPGILLQQPNSPEMVIR